MGFVTFSLNTHEHCIPLKFRLTMDFVLIETDTDVKYIFVIIYLIGFFGHCRLLEEE